MKDNMHVHTVTQTETLEIQNDEKKMNIYFATTMNFYYAED